MLNVEFQLILKMKFDLFACCASGKSMFSHFIDGQLVHKNNDNINYFAMYGDFGLLKSGPIKSRGHS